MTPSQHSTTVLTYAPVVLGIIGGIVIKDVDGGELSWVANICYGISALALFIFLKGHKTVLITEEAIEMSYLFGKEEILKKSEVDNYEKRSEYARRGKYRVTYIFHMKDGGEIELAPAFLNDEKGAKASIDKFTSTLAVKQKE